AVAELERPEPVDRDRLVAPGPKLAFVFEPAVLVPVRVGPSVAEIADEQIAAEASERARGPGETPRRVQQSPSCDPCLEVSGEVVGVDEAQALTGQLVLGGRILLRIRDEDVRAD